LSEVRLFEYREYWLVRRSDRSSLYIYWCRPGTRRVRRRSAGTSDLDEAKRKLIDFADGRNQSNPSIGGVASSAMHAPVVIGPLAAQSPPLLDVLRTYIATLADRKGSYTNAQSVLKQWLAFCEAEDIVYVHEMNLAAQERYVHWRRESMLRRRNTCSNGTIKYDLGVLKAAIRHAWKRGQLASALHVMSVPSPLARDRFLTAEESLRLLRACETKYLYRFVLLALHTLQRPKAIFELRTSQVDLVNGRINFMRPGDRQTNKRRPIVPITATLRAELESAIADSKSGFVVEYEGGPIRDNVSRSFERACAAAKISNCTPYVLRHTGATLLAAAGVPMRQIAGMLGHRTQRVTEQYAKHRPEFLRKAADTLDELFGGTTCAPAGAQRAPKGTPDKPIQLPRITSPIDASVWTNASSDVRRHAEPKGICGNAETDENGSVTWEIGGVTAGVLERAKGFEPSTLTLATVPFRIQEASWEPGNEPVSSQEAPRDQSSGDTNREGDRESDPRVEFE
jgi:integrase